jgi:hypothetical protein
LVSGDDCRLPAADQMSPADKYELVMPLSQALATGGVMLMLPATNLNKLYEAKSNSYSQYVDLGTQLPTGRMAPLLVTLSGTIESISARLGEAGPTMRFRLDEDTHTHVQALGAKVITGLSTPEARARLRKASRASRNARNQFIHYCKGTYQCLTGDFTNVVWFNRYSARNLYVYHVNTVTGKVVRGANYYATVSRQLVPGNAAQYEGVTARVLCSVTVKLQAPMRAEPQPNATVHVEFKPHQFALTGKDTRPVHHTPIEALGLEMDDDAPGDEDEQLFHGASADATRFGGAF